MTIIDMVVISLVTIALTTAWGTVAIMLILLSREENGRHD